MSPALVLSPRSRFQFDLLAVFGRQARSAGI